MGAPKTGCPNLLDSLAFKAFGCAIRNEGTHRTCHLLICATGYLSADSRLGREPPAMSALCLTARACRSAWRDPPEIVLAVATAPQRAAVAAGRDGADLAVDPNKTAVDPSYSGSRGPTDILMVLAGAMIWGGGVDQEGG